MIYRPSGLPFRVQGKLTDNMASDMPKLIRLLGFEGQGKDV